MTSEKEQFECRGSKGILTLFRIFTSGRFSIVKDREKTKVFTSSLSPGGGAYKSHYPCASPPPLTVDGGAVVIQMTGA